MPGSTGKRGAKPLSTSHQRLLAIIESSGPVTRSELADLSDLPGPTVTGLVRELLGRGDVCEREPEVGRRGTGRPARVLAVTRDPRLFGVLTWSDDSLHVSLATHAGDLVGQASREVPAAGHDPARAFGPGAELIGAAVRDAGASQEQLTDVVLSMPHPRGPTDVTADLEHRLGVPVLAENDANLAALGESAAGAGRGLESFIYVKLGHNVGAGLVFNGLLHRGSSGFAGELAHVQVRPDGPLCWCGGQGCLATLVRYSVVELLRQTRAERIAAAPESAGQVADADPGTRRILADLGRTVGRPLADLCTVLDPSALVIESLAGDDGGMVLAGVQEMINRYAAPAVAESVRVVPGRLGHRAEVLGGVALVRQHALERWRRRG